MSKFNTRVLAGAIAMVIAGGAAAAGSTTAVNSSFAWNVTNATGMALTADTGGVRFSVAAPDILIGRTASTGQITVEATLDGAVLDAALTTGDIQIPGAPLNGASVTQVSAAVGASAFQFTITPPTAGFTAGEIFTIDSLELRNATGLTTLGGNVTVAFRIRDTTTGGELTTAAATTVLSSVEATTTTHPTTASDVTIDVFAGSEKVKFKVGNTQQLFAELGEFTVDQRDLSSTTASDQLASVLGSTAAATNGVAGNGSSDAAGTVFAFDAGDDQVDVTLTVPNASAFSGTATTRGFYVDLQANACAAAIPSNGIDGAAPQRLVVDPNDATKYVGSVDIAAAAGSTYKICAVANGTSEIAAQTIGLSTTIDLAAATTRDPAAVTTASFANLKYNGPVATVRSFNPASNAAVDSLIRISNTSSVNGQISIDARCQDGSVRPTITFTLNGNNSVQYSSRELETGTAGTGKPALSGGLGACATGGRSTLTITGQIPTMKVQNFLRATVSGTTVTSGSNNEDDNVYNN